MGAYLSVDHALGEVELAHHAEGDGAPAGLGVVELALEEDGVDALLLREDLGGAGPGRAAANDGDLVLHAERRGRRRGLDGLACEGRGREGRSRGDGGSDDSEADLHGSTKGGKAAGGAEPKV